MLKNSADLHLHTFFSDGFLSPAVVLKNAHRQSLKAVAITDHDTIDGVADAIDEGHRLGIDVIPGIELTASTNSDEMHILGYFINCEDIVFRKALGKAKTKRRIRLKKMALKLAAINIKVDFESLIKFVGQGVPSRLHLAHFLYSKKLVSTVHESFEKYIGFDKPAYEKVDAFQQQEAIELILSAGGVPILAHPDRQNIENIIQPLISMGLRGLEVYHPKFDEMESAYFLSIAKKYNLLITGGSDCHGKGRFSPLIGKVKLPYEHVIKLKECATAIQV